MKKKFLDGYITFCIYALIGWIYEVSLYLINDHKFVNRGVLFGPFLPIYGFGALILLFLLKKFMQKKHLTTNIFNTSISLAVLITFIYVTYIEYTTPKIYNLSEFFEYYGLILVSINILAIIIINLIIQKSKKNSKIRNIDVTPILVFLIIWVITTSLEFVSHLAIDKLTGTILWNYSNDFLNINSRVCWDASRNFAIGGTVLLYTIQPLVNKLLDRLYENKKVLITLIIGIPMIIDFIVNVIVK